jgi:hypothetical protein
MSPKKNTPTDHDDRHPYEKPQVISEEVFETLALSCNRTDELVCDPNSPDRS